MGKTCAACDCRGLTQQRCRVAAEGGKLAKLRAEWHALWLDWLPMPPSFCAIQRLGIVVCR